MTWEPLTLVAADAEGNPLPTDGLQVLYANRTYIVRVCRPIFSACICARTPPEGWPRIVHLTVARRDGRCATNWDDLQRIKSELVGPECEGVSLFPAESRLINTINASHLWVLETPGARWPVGFDSPRSVLSDDDPRRGMPDGLTRVGLDAP